MTASAYGRLTPRMAWQLAAPHTWPAAILPVLVAAAAAAVTSFSISATMVCVLLVICVLMQSAVNTFNDYYDYVKGADSADDNVDPTDAVLVYNNVNPRAALALAVGFLAAAFLLGAYVIWIAGWIPLAIGAAGAVVVVLYSAGKTPISYLPIGELVSGFVMGGLIPLACYQALSGTFDLRALLWAVPTILGVGLIMFTNNTCDVEKDVESGRRTLSVLLGRERARKLYHGVVYDLASPDGVLLHDVVMLSDWEALTAHSWMEDAKDTEAFLHVLSASRRMRDVRASFYANERSEIVEKQFSAVTLTFPAADGEVAYLAYRGTDGSFAGWKEDFNLCFKEVIPSQCTAAAYLSGVASALACPLIVGGHSKGGNLAEYAALVADESAFERLRGVFNHDGPSFLDDPSPRIDDDRFHALLHKTVPESSAFGMILERRADYRVVRSSAMSVFQHEPFTWLTEDDDFVYQEALNPSAVFFDEALDAWLRSKAPDERERFIDTIYELFASTEAGTWSEFQTKLFANTRQLLGARSKLDAETKSFIWQTLGSLGGILKDETVKRFKPAPPTWLPRRRETYDPEKGTEA